MINVYSNFLHSFLLFFFIHREYINLFIFFLRLNRIPVHTKFSPSDFLYSFLFQIASREINGFFASSFLSTSYHDRMIVIWDAELIIVYPQNFNCLIFYCLLSSSTANDFKNEWKKIFFWDVKNSDLVFTMSSPKKKFKIFFRLRF